MQEVFSRIYQMSSKYGRHEFSSRFELNIEKAGFLPVSCVLDISRHEFEEKMSDFGLPSSFGVQEHQESREDQEGKFRPVIIDGCNVSHIAPLY